MSLLGVPFFQPIDPAAGVRGMPPMIPDEVRPRILSWARRGMELEGLKCYFDCRDGTLNFYGFRDGIMEMENMSIFIEADPFEPDRVGEPDSFERGLRAFQKARRTTKAQIETRMRWKQADLKSAKEEARGRYIEDNGDELVDFMRFRQGKRGMHKGWRKSVIVDMPLTAKSVAGV